MKCPNCEYEYEYEYIDGIPKTIKGKYDFPEAYLSNQISLNIDTNYDEIKIKISTCPECNILFTTKDIKYYLKEE